MFVKQTLEDYHILRMILFYIFRNIQEEDEEKICEKSPEIEELISKAIQASSVFLGHFYFIIGIIRIW